jgi:hypothetical protein
MSQNMNMICLWTWSPILRLTNAIPIFNERTCQISFLFVLLGATADRVKSFVPAKIADFLQTRWIIAWNPCRHVNAGIRFIWFHQMIMLNDSLLFHRSPSINYIGLHFLTTSVSERFDKRVDMCLRLNWRLHDVRSSVLSLSCTKSCNYTSGIQHWTVFLNTPAGEWKEWSRNLTHLWTPASLLRRDAPQSPNQTLTKHLSNFGSHGSRKQFQQQCNAQSISENRMSRKSIDSGCAHSSNAILKC